MYYSFKLISGHAINYHKSSTSAIGRWSEERIVVATWLNYLEECTPFIYLGMPLSGGKPPKSVWMMMVQKLENKFASWKSKYLSSCGRLILINSVLTSSPYILYPYSSCLSRWSRELIRAVGLFLGLVLRAYLQCELDGYLLLNGGGLGVKDIDDMNTAMLNKWGWRFLTKDLGIWWRLIEFA